MRLSSNQKGDFDPLLIPLVVSILLVVGVSGFGIWSYSQYLDFRDNTQKKIDVAVDDAKKVQETELEAEFAEREKNPKLSYVSNAALGSIEFDYPKTWSAYYDEDITRTREPLDAFFHPKSVPAKGTFFALRVNMSESDYVDEVDDLEDEVEKKLVTATPVLINGISGMRFDGQIAKEYKGAIILFQLRDKTVKIWTESEAYLEDYNNIVKNNLTFVP